MFKRTSILTAILIVCLFSLSACSTRNCNKCPYKAHKASCSEKSDCKAKECPYKKAKKDCTKPDCSKCDKKQKTCSGGK